MQEPEDTKEQQTESGASAPEDTPPPKKDSERLGRLREVVSSILLVLIYCYFLYNNVYFLKFGHFRLSVLILAIFNLFIVVTAIVRRSPERVSLAPFDFVVTMAGTYSVAFFVGYSGQNEILALQIISIMGLLISLAGLLSLNKSFGLLPADRGIVKSGIYKYIRHPLYSGYLISNYCFLLQNFTYRNLILFCIFAVCEMLRLLREEKLLCENEEYLQYTKETRWRIMPYVW